MSAAQILQSGGFGTVPTNWQIVGQRDGKSDIPLARQQHRPRRRSGS